MFSFHKPKIYRSMQGCCICRAKSSSSRFTDSKRYETDFIKCFEIMERRSGEICNACVLLVKRWKKLPAGSTRNWHHVVDARAGPGTKSMNKIKNKAKMEEKLLKKKHKHKHKKPKNNKASATTSCRSAGGLSDDVADYYSDRSSQSGFISNSDGSDDEGSNQSPSKGSKRRKASNPLQYSSFLDLNYWKKTEVCCGVIFKGPRGDVVIDMSLMHPCKKCCKEQKPSDGAVVSAAVQEVLASSQAAAATPTKSDSNPESPSLEETLNDDDADSEDEDDDMLDDLEDDDIMEEMDLDDDMIGGNMDALEDDDCADSGLGSQEMSTTEVSPHPGTLQTAAAMLQAMSTGAGLLPSITEDKSPATASRSRHCSGEVLQSTSSPSSSNLHSASAASSSSSTTQSVTHQQQCIQLQMVV